MDDDNEVETVIYELGHIKYRVEYAVMTPAGETKWKLSNEYNNLIDALTQFRDTVKPSSLIRYRVTRIDNGAQECQTI